MDVMSANGALRLRIQFSCSTNIGASPAVAAFFLGTVVSLQPCAPLLRARLTPLIRKTQPYSKRIAHRGIWVEPQLLAEIEYRAKSAEGKVRHPFFKGLREDL